MASHEKHYMKYLSRFSGPITGVELGPKNGERSEAFLRRSDLYLVMVDPWSTDVYPRWSQEKHDQHRKDAEERTAFAVDRRLIIQETSIDALKILQGDEKWSYLDFVCFDSIHQRDLLTADLVAYSEMLKLGGLLIGRYYQRRRKDGSYSGNPRIKQTIDDFCESKGYTVEFGWTHAWCATKTD